MASVRTSRAAAIFVGKNSPVWEHAFQRAGLGKAPFRVMSYAKEMYQACPGAPIQCGTSCDYCGQGIMHVYRIIGSAPEDKIFKVGCDCALRTGDTELGEALRRERRKAEHAEREAAWAVKRAERDAAEARAREQRAAWNAENMAEEIDQALTVSESGNASSYEKKISECVYRELTEGERTGITDRERQIISIAFRAAPLPASKHIGTAGVRLRDLKARYEGGPTIGIDSFYGPSVLAKFRITEGPDAGALLIWKTKYHPCKRGAIVSLTGTVDKERPHSDYEGIKQTKVSRCKVEVLDESDCIAVND